MCLDSEQFWCECQLITAPPSQVIGPCPSVSSLGGEGVCGLWTPHGTDWTPVGTRNSRLHVREACPLGTGWEATDAPSRGSSRGLWAFPVSGKTSSPGWLAGEEPWAAAASRHEPAAQLFARRALVDPAVMTQEQMPSESSSSTAAEAILICQVCGKWDFLLLFPNRNS